MPDILSETIISQAEAARLLRCRLDTATRFVNEGDEQGARLEAAELSSGWVTSVEAVYRFANNRSGRHRGRAACFLQG